MCVITGTGLPEPRCGGVSYLVFCDLLGAQSKELSLRLCLLWKGQSFSLDGARSRSLRS